MTPAIEGAAIVAKAREYLGTPWHHEARLKRVGIDCSGLLICVLNELGVEVEDIRGYGLNADNFPAMEAAIRKWCDPVPEGEPRRPGDIALFRSRLMWNHCGFVTPETLIHAYNGSAWREVIEQPWDDGWELRLFGIFRYRGAWQPLSSASSALESDTRSAALPERGRASRSARRSVPT